MRPRIFGSWSQFKSKISAYLTQETRPDLWFRGQGDSRWPLQTTLDRFRAFSDDAERDDCYAELLRLFQEESIGLGDAIAFPAGIALDLLARHHGLPSLLLDWTRSPYVAAFFAYEDAVKRAVPLEHISVWALNRDQLRDDFPAADMIDDRQLLWYNPRALAQAGIFLRIRTIRESVETILGKSLSRFDLPFSERRVALRDLDGMNITARNLFRDLDGAARTAQMRLMV